MADHDPIEVRARFTPREYEALIVLAKAKDLPMEQVLRQALRTYQLVDAFQAGKLDECPLCAPPVGCPCPE
jgi:hypothetical protein